jgi:hypothetical protein
MKRQRLWSLFPSLVLNIKVENDLMPRAEQFLRHRLKDILTPRIAQLALRGHLI